MTDHKQRYANAVGGKLGPVKGKWKVKPFPFPPPPSTQFPRPAHDTSSPRQAHPAPRPPHQSRPAFAMYCAVPHSPRMPRSLPLFPMPPRFVDNPLKINEEKASIYVPYMKPSLAHGEQPHGEHPHKPKKENIMNTYKITVKAWGKNHTYWFKTDSLKSAIRLARQDTMCNDAKVLNVKILQTVAPTARCWWTRMEEA